MNTLNDVLSGIKHEASLDANDLTVHKLSFLILLYYDHKFCINSTFIDLIYFVIMFTSYVHKKFGFFNAALF